MPVFKGEHRPPVQPEVGIEHLVVEVVGYPLVVQLLVRREEESHDLHGALVRQSESAVCMCILASVHRSPAERVVRVPLVEPIVLVQYADAFRLDRRYASQQVPHDLEMVVHFPSATHDIAQTRVVPAIAGSTWDGILLIDVDPVSGHLAVPDQIARRSQCSQTRANDMGALRFDAFGFPRMCEGFVVSA